MIGNWRSLRALTFPPPVRGVVLCSCVRDGVVEIVTTGSESPAETGRPMRKASRRAGVRYIPDARNWVRACASFLARLDQVGGLA